MPPPFGVVVLTPPSLPASPAREARTLAALLDAGATAVHVRKPGADAAAVAGYLRGLPPRVLRAAVLHSHHGLAAEFGVRGLHYTERLRAAGPPARRPGLTASASLHSLADVAAASGDVYDYVLLSPVFDSISKQGYGAAGFPRAQLTATLASCPVPVLALGGVSSSTAAAAADLGFAGAALLGSVWGVGDDHAPDDAAAVAELRAVIDAF